MSSADTTLGDVGRWASRYAPYLGLVLAVTLTVGLAPGEGPPGSLASSDTAGSGSLALDGGAQEPDASLPDAGAESGAAAVPEAEVPGAAAVDGAATGSTAGAATAGGTSGSAPEAVSGGTGGGTGGGASGGTGGGTGGGAPAVGTAGAAPGGSRPVSAAAARGSKNCDPKTGKLRMPIIVAPACVPGFDGDNGGATSRGVTRTSIKVVVYSGQPDPAAQAIARAGGSDDTPEQVRQQIKEWIDLYSATLETYGRTIELTYLEASGEDTDDSAGRADALKVVKSGAFASLGAPNSTYIAELAANGVMCLMCGTGLPAESYVKWAPYVWNVAQSSTWTNIHNVNFMQKFLWDKPAQYAGDPTMTTKKRVIGRVSYDTADGSFKAARDYFEKEVKRRGMKLAANAVFNGYPDTTKAQEQARPIIQKMKAAGVTTVLLASDPFSPIFFTQEATRQQYFPEWVGTGVLVDTAFFARLYDQQQWAHAFAPSTLSARLPEEKTDSFRLLQWFYGRGPTAEAGYNLIRLPIDLLMRGVHHAGENLTPQTYRAGMFALPPRQGGKSFSAVSYGTKLWPLPDYTGTDDVSLVWWDARAAGPSETGSQGVGLYRYVNGGQRYLPTKYPASVKFFDPAGTVLLYDDYPAGETPPEYPRPAKQ